MWKNLKAEARKKAAEERQSLMKTGGGQSQVVHIDPLLIEVLELIQFGAVGLLNQFDSDGTFNNVATAATGDTQTICPITENQEDTDNISEQDRLVNGDWGEYSSSKLRTPKAQILKELPHCDFEVGENGHLRISQIEGSSSTRVGEGAGSFGASASAPRF
nr:unnamed protein product [Callosobruchus analis]